MYNKKIDICLCYCHKERIVIETYDGREDGKIVINTHEAEVLKIWLEEMLLKLKSETGAK
jgi:hypothetical protein